MSDSVFSRRAVLGTALALPLAAAPSLLRAQGLGESAAPAGAVRFRSVAVDLGPVLARGGGNPARELGQFLLGEMRAAFADRLGRGGPLLTARVSSMSFTIYSGRDTDFAFGGNDSIEGDGIVSSGGRVLSSTHVLTELPPSYSGAYYTEDIDRIRVRSIAHQFAYWLRREMQV